MICLGGCRMAVAHCKALYRHGNLARDSRDMNLGHDRYARTTSLLGSVSYRQCPVQ